jgi:hypothetical protein
MALLEDKYIENIINIDAKNLIEKKPYNVLFSKIKNILEPILLSEIENCFMELIMNERYHSDLLVLTIGSYATFKDNFLTQIFYKYKAPSKTTIIIDPQMDIDKVKNYMESIVEIKFSNQKYFDVIEYNNDKIILIKKSFFLGKKFIEFFNNHPLLKIKIDTLTDLLQFYSQKCIGPKGYNDKNKKIIIHDCANFLLPYVGIFEQSYFAADNQIKLFDICQKINPDIQYYKLEFNKRYRLQMSKTANVWSKLLNDDSIHNIDIHIFVLFS